MLPGIRALGGFGRMSDDPIRFSRVPYTVTYQDLAGKIQTIRRVPPPKLHDALPTDIVELTQKHSDDFEAGDEAEVQYINPKHPNVLQIRNGKGDTAFIDYFDMNLIDEVAPRAGVDPRDKPQNNRYLLWP
jgi:hypothetical protein